MASGRPNSKSRVLPRFEYDIWLTIFGIALFSFGIRLMLLDRYPAPPSGDFGNYLNISNIILGTDVTGQGLRYPPLFFLVLIPFVKALGPMLGLKVVAAIVASSCCVPMFLFLLRRANYLAAILVTLLFTFSQAMAEMTAWGGSPNFLAMTFMIFALYFLDRAFSPRHSHQWNAVFAGVCVGLTFETHHLTTMVLMITLGMVFLILLAWNTPQGRVRTLRVLAFMLIPAILIALPGIPIYMRIQEDLSTSLGAYGPPALDALIGPGGFKYITGPFWLAWVVVFSLGAAAIGHSIMRRALPTGFKAILVGSALTPLLIGMLVIGEAPGRVFLYMETPLILGLGILIVRVQRWASEVRVDFRFFTEFKNLFLTLLVVNVLILVAAGAQWMSFAVDWYHPLERDDVLALDWIAENTPREAVFATSGKILAGHKEGDRIGWWIQGYAQRNAYMAGSERFRLFDDELVSARDMNRFFTGTHVIENGYLQVSDQFPVQYRGNPEIAARRDGNYEAVAFLNDAMHVVRFYGDGAGGEETMRTLVGAAPSEFRVSHESAQITTTAGYEFDELEFFRVTTLGYLDKTVRIQILLSPRGGTTLSGFSMSIWCPHGSSFEEMDTADSASRFLVTDPWKNPTVVQVSVQAGTGQLSSHEFLKEDPVWHLPVLWLDFEAAGDDLWIEIAFETDPDERDQLAQLAYHNGYEILSRYGVGYLYVSRAQGLEIERFEKDAEHFEPVFSNDGVVIFRVLPPFR